MKYSNSLLGSLILFTALAFGSNSYANELTYNGTLTWRTAYPLDIEIDSQGNKYLSGMFSQSHDFDPTEGTDIQNPHGRQNDAFITKLNSDGSYGWTRTFGGIENDNGSKVVVDSQSNVYVAGTFANTVDFDPTSNVNSFRSRCVSWSGCSYSYYHYDIYVSKFDKDGNYQWTRVINADYGDQLSSLKLDKNDNLYLTGVVSGNPDFDSTPGANDTQTTSGRAGFITKINSDGSYGWSKAFSAGSNAISDVTFASNGDILLVGSFRGTADMDFGSGVTYITSQGADDAFLIRLDSAGNYLSSLSFGGSDVDGIREIEVNSQDDIYVTGSFRGTTDFDPTTGSNIINSVNGTYDVYLTKLNSDGSYSWTYHVPGSRFDMNRGIEVDSNGVVYLLGHYGYYTNYDYGLGPMFLHRINADGTLDQAVNYGWADPDGGVELFNDKDIYIAGGYRWNSSFDFDPTSGVDRRYANTNGNAFLTSISFAPLNEPPVADAGLAQVVEATAIMTPVTLNGSSSYDPDSDILSFSWSGDFGIVTGMMPTVEFAIGEYTINLSVDDGNGGTSHDYTTVTVQDTTPPEFTTLPDEMTVIAEGPQTHVTLTTPEVSDIFPFTLSNDAPDSYPVGTTEVTWTATDIHGNSSTVIQKVNVNYDFVGFMPPVKNGGNHKAGRTLPVKFQLAYANGKLTDDGKATLSMDGNHIGDFRYIGNHYHYNLKTSKQAAGTHTLTVTLDDGTSHQVIINLK